MDKKKRDFEPERGWFSRFIHNIFSGIGWLIRQAGRATAAVFHWCWWLIAAGFSGTGRAISWTFRLIGSIFGGIWNWLTGGNRAQYSDPEHEAIRRRVEAHFRRRTRFFSHLVVFGFVNGGFWMGAMIYAFQERFVDLGGLFFFTAVWTMFLVLHLVRYLMGEEKERTIAREIERNQQRRATPPPEDDLDGRVLRLSNDGELVYDEEQQASRKSKRN